MKKELEKAQKELIVKLKTDNEKDNHYSIGYTLGVLDMKNKAIEIACLKDERIKHKLDEDNHY